MKKQEVLKKLTDLYDICDDQSEHADDGWRNIALAISTAEDVTQKEIDWDNEYPQSADQGSVSLINSLEHWAKCFRDGTLDDSNAEEIAYFLEDKAHGLKQLNVWGENDMTLYIQLRDEIVDEEPARQMWIKADSIEVCYSGITYLDSKTGKWLWLERVSDHDDTEWRFCGDVELNDGWDADIAPFDFMFIRDRLMENCKLGYTGE